MVIFFIVGGQQRIAEKCEKFLTCWVCICMNFHRVWTKRHKIADNFWTEVWWDLNLSQLVVSDFRFQFSTSGHFNLTSFFDFRFQFSTSGHFNLTSFFFFFFFFNSIFNAGWDFIWYFSSSRFACLFVWTQVQHRNWRPTSVSDQVWFF